MGWEHPSVPPDRLNQCSSDMSLTGKQKTYQCVHSCMLQYNSVCFDLVTVHDVMQLTYHVLLIVTLPLANGFNCESLFTTHSTAIFGYICLVHLHIMFSRSFSVPLSCLTCSLFLSPFLLYLCNLFWLWRTMCLL